MKLADAYGIPGFRVTTVDELDTTLAKAAGDHRLSRSWSSSASTPTRWCSRWSPSGASNDEILESAEEWHARVAARHDEMRRRGTLA